MRFRELRSILQRVVLVGLPACTTNPISGRCDSASHYDVTIANPAPPMQLRIESCRVDADACPDLCNAVAVQQNVIGFVSKCDVSFDAQHAYVSMDTSSFCGTGRMPVGLVPVYRERAADAGAWLARAAWLEAASVPAFVFLSRELDLHGAPQALVGAALVAANDEVRHAALVGSLARRYGAQPPPAEVAAFAPRPLEALAIENAVEGCVRETWGAALALRQSVTARDPGARAAFAAIANDELRHAELGWAIDRWASARLGAAANARVAAARDAAADALLDSPPDPALPALGLPDEAEHRALRARAHAALWNGGVA